MLSGYGPAANLLRLPVRVWTSEFDVYRAYTRQILKSRVKD